VHLTWLLPLITTVWLNNWINKPSAPLTNEHEVKSQ